MKLSKSDALLVHSTIFSYVNSSENITEEDFTQLESLRNRLHEFLVEESDLEGCQHYSEFKSEEEEDSSEDEDEDEDEDEEEKEVEDNIDEDFEVDQYVTAKDAADLPPISVVSPDGSKISLEFEDVGDDASVDALFDEGSVIIDQITCVHLEKNVISLYDGETWHDFKTKKSPKSWIRVFPHGKTIGFDSGEDE